MCSEYNRNANILGYMLLRNSLWTIKTNKQNLQTVKH